MSPRLGGLWRHPDFVRVWAGASISAIGSQVTLIALLVLVWSPVPRLREAIPATRPTIA